ncbi:MAG: tRNA (N(6)-L-threonylcarbamoyladenosine(37)-C(2))-methylthiotransferase MtaB [Bryobacterales bacterium]|nr:tRNA (N(6)-L-threonylcarbamoyladenosine(37)-C(2))-methylthiotransferase MtaB [Bryobacterales bacterium]MDE0293275.1 tRNA (N(6)-L-threonylcarbamoyladenosine(37)-C(2))-methylthiotransferase MtaB [Bryobacterales bacterium]
MRSRRRFPTKSFSVRSYGCRASQSDGAAIAADLQRRGLETASGPADLVVINTCTVTSEADRDARQAIRRAHRENPEAEILVTGCYAQRHPTELADLPGVKWVIGNSHKTRIGTIVAEALVKPSAPVSQAAYHGEISLGGTLVGNIFDQKHFLSAPVVEAGPDRTRPNLKIQDGCGNRCSFCVIPSVRGASRSAPIGFVIEQVRMLSERYSEVVLTGINLGRWGRDLPEKPRLAHLLRMVLIETDVAKLRLSSIEPMDWTEELLELVATTPRLAKHVHIPLQSASDTVLRRMRRRYRARHYASRIEKARSLMPTASIGADVMVGFPGESDLEFEETRRFITEMPFTYLHVFSYSSRPGTEASEMADEPVKPVKKLRNRVLRELAAEKNLAFRSSLIGAAFDAVTLDQRAGGGSRALTDNYIPVRLPDQELAPGMPVRVRLSECNGSTTLARLA